MKTEFDLSTASVSFSDKVSMPDTATIPQVKKFKEALESYNIKELFEEIFEVPYDEAEGVPNDEDSHTQDHAA